MALFNVFQAENYFYIEIKWVGTGKDRVAMETKCSIAVGVLSQGLRLTVAN